MQILSVPHAGAILANYLVVAGGASGANRVGGGGGAGGVRSTKDATGGAGSLQALAVLSSGITYTITVGAGGAVPSGSVQGINGDASSISGTGLVTISTVGGGGGGVNYSQGGRTPGAGGSSIGGAGSGGNVSANATAGTVNTGSGGGGAGLDNGDTATFTGGAGGSGIVIVDAGITAASTTGSPTLSGTKYTFTGSGSITF